LRYVAYRIELRRVKVWIVDRILRTSNDVEECFTDRRHDITSGFDSLSDCIAITTVNLVDYAELIDECHVWFTWIWNAVILRNRRYHCNQRTNIHTLRSTVSPDVIDIKPVNSARNLRQAHRNTDHVF